MTTTTTTTTPTPTPNPYAPIVAKPNIPQGAPGAPIPAPVTKTPDFASQNAAAAADHNRLVLANSGLKVGGSKRSGSKRRGSKSKQKRGSKSKQRRGSKRSGSKSKRSGSKSKRSKRKRGGASFIPTTTTTTTTTPTPTPTVKAVTVPQFSGSPSASAASLNNNHLAMKGAAQAALDNPNAPPTYTKLA